MDLQEARAILANVAEHDDDTLDQAMTALADRAAELRENLTAENLDELRELAQVAEEAGQARDAIAAERQAAEAEADELLARIPGLTNAAPEGDEDDAAAGEDSDGGVADIVVPDDASELTPEPVPAANTSTVQAAARRSPAQPPAAPARTTPRAAAAFNQASRRGNRPTPPPAEPAERPLVAAGALQGFHQGEAIANLAENWTRFADGVSASAQRHRAAPRFWSDADLAAAEYADFGGGKKVSLASIPVRFGADSPVMVADAHQNEEVLGKVARDTRAQFQRALDPAIVAAGGCPCAPYPVDYSIFNLVESYNPMEGDLPSVEMPRGGLRYMECLDWTTYAAGTEVRDCADENVAIGSYVAKPCVRITCPGERSTSPIIIPACLTVGNFIQNTYPEMVRQALEWLTVHYEDLKQVAYQDAIRTAAVAGTNYTAAAAYGAARSYISALTRATAMYRARRHMRPDSPLQVHVPYFLPWIIANDVMNQGYGGLQQFNDMGEAEAWFRDQLRKISVVPTFWYLRPTAVAANQWIDRAQADAGALNAWPTTVDTVITAPGVWNRGQIADIDFGLVVDSPLIKTNDTMFFMETMVSIFDRCSTATEMLTTTLCANGDAAGLSTPFTCP